MQKIYLLICVLSIYLTSCQEDYESIPRKEKLPKIAFTTLDDEPYLKGALENYGLLSTKTPKGRIMGGLSNFSQDSIIKILQSDSLSYTYTIKLNTSTSNSFMNLVLRKSKTGFIGFVLKYESDSTSEMPNFKGRVKKYNLEGDLLAEKSVNQSQANAKVNACSVSFSKVCSEERFDGWDQSTGKPITTCIGSTTLFITFDCTESFPDRSIATSGTYIYDYYSGGGGSASGGGGGGSDSGVELSTFDEGDPIGVTMPTNEEIEAWIESITDPEEKRRAQLDYLRSHGASDFVRMVDDLIATPGLTIGEVWDINTMVNSVYLNQKAEFFIAIFNPHTVGTILTLGLNSPSFSAPVRSNYFRLVARYAATNTGKGYSSFEAFKQAHGAAGEGKAWHHLVQQTESNVQRFGAEKVHNVNNLIRIEHGAGSWHQRITNYYNSIQEFTEGKRFYQWVAEKSFQEQYEWALKIMEITKIP